MKNHTHSHVTSPFVNQHEADVIGVLSRFDRWRLRGTLRSLYHPSVLLRYLYLRQVLLKGFQALRRGLDRTDPGPRSASGPSRPGS